MVSGRLKICFWETGVPVRIRPRPPLRKHARLTLDFRFALISTEFSPSHPRLKRKWLCGGPPDESDRNNHPPDDGQISGRRLRCSHRPRPAPPSTKTTRG